MATGARRGRPVESRPEPSGPTVPLGVLFAAVIYLGFGILVTYRVLQPWLDNRNEPALWQSVAAAAATLIVVVGLFFLQRWAWRIAVATVLLPLLALCALLWMAYGSSTPIGPEELQQLVPFAPVVATLLLVATVMLLEPASRRAFRAAREARRAPPEPERPTWPEVEVIRDGWS